MPSASATRPTSPTVSRISSRRSLADSGPKRRASSPAVTGKPALHQAPLRPEAPKPVVSASSTATSRAPRGTTLASVAELFFELREGPVGDLRYPAQDVPVGDEGRGELDDGIVLVVEAADQAALKQLPGDDALEVLLVLVARQRRSVGLDGVHLDGPEEAHPADLLDDRMPFGHPPQLVPEVPLEVVDVLEQVLALQDRDVLQRHSRGDRVPAEGRTV